MQFLICPIFLFVFTLMFESASILVTVIKFKRPFSFLNFVYLITFKLSCSQFLEHFKKFSSYNTSVFESSNHFSSSFLNAWFFRCQPQHFVPNSLKGFLETKYILFLICNRNFSSWIFNVQSNVLFLVIISKKYSKYKPQFLTEILRKSLILVFSLTHFGHKNMLLLTFILNKWMWLMIFCPMLATKTQN